ncbi:MAG: GNAT family N-acetyltransferase [Thermoanaerobaculia bacterium]|nr:GNAT family N-acetyltransferase [Thermoanaerobaculia bacterium]
MTESIDIRPATSDDTRILFEVYASTRTEELAPVPWTTEQKLQFLAFQFQSQGEHYRQMFPDATFDVIEVEGTPAGRLYVNRTGGAIHVIDIALLPWARGRGIGGKILRDLCAEGAAKGLPVTISVEKFNPAKQLYERLGFRMFEDGEVYQRMEWRAGVS